MPKRVLIADDEHNIVFSLEFLMRQAGYQVQSTFEGDEALRALSVFKPDLILLDIMLPLRDGFEVCRDIRTDALLNTVKIILLTARGREVEIARGLELGADRYITKPFATRELLAAVTQLIGPASSD